MTDSHCIASESVFYVLLVNIPWNSPEFGVFSSEYAVSFLTEKHTRNHDSLTEDSVQHS